MNIIPSTYRHQVCRAVFIVEKEFLCLQVQEFQTQKGTKEYKTRKKRKKIRSFFEDRGVRG